uniref:RRM domain-containing protein n=1 Tax=Leersia perrieri TaxID=77586 RepID=A0A0D9WL98_9ORYZ
MADAYWRYDAAARQQQQHQLPHSAAAGVPPVPSAPPPGPASHAVAAGQQLKRPRPADFSDHVPGAPEMAGYYSRDDERAGFRAARDNEALNASYERFLRTGQVQSYGAGPGAEPIRPPAGGNAGYPIEDRLDRPMMAGGGGMDGRNIGFGGGMPEPSLPPDASNTLFIEGIPIDCPRREVSRILRSYAFLCQSLSLYLHK